MADLMRCKEEAVGLRYSNKISCFFSSRLDSGIGLKLGDSCKAEEEGRSISGSLTNGLSLPRLVTSGRSLLLSLS
jgi:hypothetical protein